ncbi:response regulator [Parvibaculum sedimenti]|uniref:Regulatory protein VirG n=1 Tax=Parvibaculum sedimenti TaxID=2608632 RepID=A0A6N6VH84_9HYPH|nr:response regulator [Parvibaculum sedimenti]KAB7739077.1 response regulator [Parvibaculum sedimenti]
MNASAHISGIVIVEDDREVGELVKAFLVKEGFDVRLARSGVEMDRALLEKHADLIILDLMLPGEDGLSICRRLRARSNVPILILTAKGDDIDKIIGLELGADDYMAKPFNPRELLARIRSILRRTVPAIVHGGEGERMRFGEFVLDLGARRLFRDGVELQLSTGDFDLLTVLVHHPQRLLSRDQLMDMTRGRSWEAFDRSIDVAMSRLRRKIEDDASLPAYIKTVRNVGYMLAVPAERV